jgi:hypothetical protein
MKIWFRTGHERRGAERGEGQGSEQSRPAGVLRPSVFSAATCSVQSAARRNLLAHPSLRRGAACCARCSAANRRYPLADTRLGSRQGTAFYPELRRAAVPNAAPTSGVSTPEVRVINGPTTYETGCSHSTPATRHCPNISTRFCPKSRSHTKHTTKPPLPGSRFAHCHARASIAKALSNRELRSLELSLTSCKQTIAPRSNRELSTNRVRLALTPPAAWRKMARN